MTCRGFLYIFPVNKSNDCPNWWTSPKTLRTTGLTTGQYPQRAHNGCALRCDWNGVGMLKFWGETNRPSRKQIWMKAGAKSRVMQFGQLPFCATVTDHKKTMAKTGPIDLVGAICYRFSVLNRHPSIWCKCSRLNHPSPLRHPVRDEMCWKKLMTAFQNIKGLDHPGSPVSWQ